MDGEAAAADGATMDDEGGRGAGEEQREKPGEEGKRRCSALLCQ